MTVLVVVQEITQGAGVFCATSKEVQFAHVWVGGRSLLSGAGLVDDRQGF